MQESFAFLILGVGRLREDQHIYVESTENVFFIIWDLSGSSQVLWVLTMSPPVEKTHSLEMDVARMERYAVFLKVRDHCALKLS